MEDRIGEIFTLEEVATLPASTSTITFLHLQAIACCGIEERAGIAVGEHQSLILHSGLFSGISGCHLALSADQELIEPPTHRVVNRVFLFITRMAPQGPTRLIDVF